MFEDSSGRDYFDETGRLHSYGDLTGGHRIFVQYDSLKRIRAAVDESGRVLTFRYGQDGRLESIVPPDGHAIAFRYSASGYLSEVSYANGERVGYLYDEAGYAARGGAFGALTGVIQADGGRFSSTYYDAAGRATQPSSPAMSMLSRQRIPLMRVSSMRHGLQSRLHRAQFVT